MDAAEELRADDFELVTPTGGRASKESHLSSMATDALDDRIRETERMEARLYGRAALIRYRDAGFEAFALEPALGVLERARRAP